MKSIFITGGTTGIGYHLANEYLLKGYRVGVCGRDLSKLDPEYNGLSYQADVSDENSIKTAIDKFAEGGLDIIFANAGIALGGNKTKMPDWERSKQVIDINVLGFINTCQAAIPYFVEQGSGHLVATASVAGLVGLPGASSYSASKAAVIKLMESYTLDLETFGINCTTIMPGFIKTPLTDKNKHGMPFLMQPEDAIKIMMNAIAKKKKTVMFPWQMAILMWILARLPRVIYRTLMKLPFANYGEKI